MKEAYMAVMGWDKIGIHGQHAMRWETLVATNIR